MIVSFLLRKTTENLKHFVSSGTLERRIEMQKRLLMAACLAVCLEDSVCRQGPAASVAIPRPPVGSTYKRQQEDKEEKKNVAARAEKIQRIASAEFEALQVRTISFIGPLLAFLSSDLLWTYGNTREKIQKCAICEHVMMNT